MAKRSRSLWPRGRDLLTFDMENRIEILTVTAQETVEFAKRFALSLRQGTVLCLEGPLGSGKTTFVKGLAQGLGLKCSEQVKSPTFVLMHVYKSKIPVYHFDCYRLSSAEELENIGFEDFVNDPKAIVCVEWAEKAGELIPCHARHIHFELLDATRRRITVL